MEIIFLNKFLVDNSCIVIASRGGGIPVVRKGHEIVGVEAVIDKDLSICRLAIDIKINILLILTDVDKVALNYNTPHQRWIDKMNTEETRRYLSEGHFKEGSMKPNSRGLSKIFREGGRKGHYWFSFFCSLCG